MILKPILLIAATVFSLGVFAGSDEKASPDPLYFYQDWCPRPVERDALAKHFKLTMAGCCIFRAERLSLESEAATAAVQPMMSHVSPEQDFSFCRGDNPELKLEREEMRKAMAAEERKGLAEALRFFELPTLCVEAAKLIKGVEWFITAPNMQGAALPFIYSELRRRGMPLNERRVKDSTFQVGDSECQLYAAWGPSKSRNNTTTESGRNVQHVYGHGSYVYTTNGRISGFQQRD